MHLSENHFSTITVINIRHRNRSTKTFYCVTNAVVNPKSLDKLTEKKETFMSHENLNH